MKIVLLFFLLISISSCVFKADEVKLKGFDLAKARGGSTTPTEEIVVEVSSVILESDRLKVTGVNLDSVTSIKLDSSDLSIVSQSANELVLSSSTVLNLALNTAMDLIFTNAYGQSVTTVQFDLVDGSVVASKIADGAVTNAKIADGAVDASKLSDMSAGIGQVLKFNGTTWVPGDLSSLTYAGNWDATGNSPDLSGGGSLGEFYIVNNAGSFDLAGGAGTNSWAVGDWAVWNNVGGQWEKIDNATNVQSFNGRSGAVTAATNDYTWNQIDKTVSSIADIADVDTTGVADGKILKYQSGSWVIADDLSSGGAGSVSTSEIADGTITNADINAGAAIDQSKISGLPALASSVASNTSDISTNQTNIATNTSNITSNDTDIATNASNISSLSTTVGTKADSARSLTAGSGLSGGGDLSADRSFAVNVDDATIEIATDILQVKNIPDTKLTTACADGEVLSANSGAFVCAASTTIGNWTENSGDLYYTLGNVGIGSTAPGANLEIDSTINTDAGLILRMGSASSGQNKSYIGFENSSGTELFRTYYDNAIEKYVIASDSASEIITVERAGNVGIGTTNPSSKLEVVGTVTATAFSGDGSSLSNVTSSATAAGAGSVSTPSISFSGDTNTGFYQASSGSDSIDIAVGGANIFNISSNGIVSPTAGGASVSTGAGSATTPTFSFGGDLDTGWYSPAADTLAASTNGGEKIRISPSGNIGIGTTSPAALLHVSGNIRGVFDSIDDRNDVTTPETLTIRGARFNFKLNATNGLNDGGLYNGVMTYRPYGTASDWSGGPSHQIGFTENGNLFHRFGENTTWNTWRRIIEENASGNVGIGTTSPTSRLHIHNGSLLITDNSRTDGGHISSTARGATITDGDLQLGDEDGTIMTLNEAMVGIGTTTPGVTLDVQGDIGKFRAGESKLQGLRIGSASVYGASGASEIALVTEVAQARGGTGGNIEQYVIKSDGYDVYIQEEDTANTIINPNGGNVGIGVASPETALHVNGDMTLGGNYQVLKITSTAADRWVYLGQINNISGSNSTAERGYVDIEIFNGRDIGTRYSSGTRLIATTRDAGISANHENIGNLSDASADRSSFHIYNDGSNNYHLYVYVTAYGYMNIRVNQNNNVSYVPVYDSTPTGSEVYSTAGEGTLNRSIGSLNAGNIKKKNRAYPWHWHAKQTALFTTSSTTFSDIPGATITYTLPAAADVKFSLDGSLNAANLSNHCGIAFVLNGVNLGHATYGNLITMGENGQHWQTVARSYWIDAQPAGTYTIKLQAVSVDGGTCSNSVENYSAFNLEVMGYEPN